MLETTVEISIYELQVQIFKMVTHPVRLAILDILTDGVQCVCYMEAHVRHRQSMFLNK